LIECKWAMLNTELSLQEVYCNIKMLTPLRMSGVIFSAFRSCNIRVNAQSISVFGVAVLQHIDFVELT